MKITTLLPFMEREEIKELAKKILNKEVKGVNIVTLYPFLDKETMSEIFDLMLEKGETKSLYSCLPFLSKKQIGTLYDKVQKGEVKGFKEAALLPFLGKSKIKDLFDSLVKEATEKADNSDEDEESDPIGDAIDEAFDE